MLANAWGKQIFENKVGEDVGDGCTELLGLDATQECTNALDKKEVVQYIESGASKALDTQATNKVLREALHRVAKKARVAPAAGRKRKAGRSEIGHDGAEQELTKYLPFCGCVSRRTYSTDVGAQAMAPAAHAPVLAASTAETQNASLYC